MIHRTTALTFTAGKHSQKSDDLRLRSGEGGRANDGKAGTVSRDLFSALQGETQRQLKDLVYQAIRKAAGDDGWAELGHVGNLIKKAQGDFEARHYGFARLLDLVVSVPAVVSKTGDAPSEIFVRRLSWRHFIMLVQEIINSYANARGEASLAAVCCAFGQRHPDFDVRSLGHRKLPDAVRAIHGAWVEVHCLEGIEMLRMGQRMT